MHACLYVCLVSSLSVCPVCVCVRAYVRADGRAYMYICMFGWLADCLFVLCAYVRMCVHV